MRRRPRPCVTPGLVRPRARPRCTPPDIPFSRVDSARGVLAPVRLRGPVGGVVYRSQVAERNRATSPYEIFDCRLVLALDDLSKLLQKMDVSEVIHYSAYRPPPRRGWVPGRVGSRHSSGVLALDIGRLVKRDGTSLDVEKHFHGRIGAPAAAAAPRRRPPRRSRCGLARVRRRGGPPLQRDAHSQLQLAPSKPLPRRGDLGRAVVHRSLALRREVPSSGYGTARCANGSRASLVLKGPRRRCAGPGQCKADLMRTAAATPSRLPVLGHRRTRPTTTGTPSSHAARGSWPLRSRVWRAAPWPSRAAPSRRPRRTPRRSPPQAPSSTAARRRFHAATRPRPTPPTAGATPTPTTPPRLPA